MFANAVRRAAVQQDGKALREIVDGLFEQAKQGDVQAIKEIADRLDGKPSQQLVHAADAENPLTLRIVSEDSKL